jgi:hypothetical protein
MILILSLKECKLKNRPKIKRKVVKNDKKNIFNLIKQIFFFRIFYNLWGVKVLFAKLIFYNF